MFYKSIRFKITILYMAILALTLTTFSVILYHNVSRGLYANMDTLLKSKAGGVSQAINTYWEVSRLETVEGGLAPETLKKRRNVNFAGIAQKWVKEKSGDPKLIDIIVKVFDTDGAIIASSKNREPSAEISRSDFISVLQGRSRFDTVKTGARDSDPIDFRIFTTPVFENEKVAYIVQVASPLDSIYIALNDLKIALFILFPITVFATGMMGAFLAKVTLHPVDNMIETIRQITAENMNVKLRIPATKDEIQKLAETFNDMLGRLERTFTTQKQLFEDLSHELKTPLTILKGEFEVALKKIRSQEEYGDVVKSALEEINRIIKLAENLLLLAKFDAKEVAPDKKRLSLSGLLQVMVNNVKGLAESKRLEIVFRPRGDIFLYGDEGQLKILFLNILDNALKYTPAGGKLYISAEKDEGSAKVVIRDTGVGIPKEDLGHIFDRFYRVDKSRQSAGFGLGLSIAKSIAEAHDGTIGADTAPDGGAAFTITLPA